MKICMSCSSEFKAENWRCPVCGFLPPRIDGFVAFSLAQAENNTGFKSEYFDELARLENNNFWFYARNHLITWGIGKYFSNIKKICEVGCGTGFVLSSLAKAYPDSQLIGSEIFSSGLRYAAQRVPKALLFQMDARRIPFKEEFDIIGAFDVLEHIEEDECVLKEIHKALVPGGGVVLTVPQHHFLWSRQDEFAHHVRRYRSGELETKLTQCGFRVVLTTSFVSLLLPFMYLSRRCNRLDDEKFDGMAELRINGILNMLLRAVMTIELFLVRVGITFPWGGSLFVVAKKKEGEQ